MKSEDSYVKLESEWAEKVKKRRQEIYNKVRRGLYKTQITSFDRHDERIIAAEICRELFGVRWQPLREVN